jgi:hypothetical protein
VCRRQKEPEFRLQKHLVCLHTGRWNNCSKSSMFKLK